MGSWISPPATQKDAGSVTEPCMANFGDPNSSLLAWWGCEEERVDPWRWAGAPRGTPAGGGCPWGGGGEAAWQSQLLAAAYAVPEGPFKPSKLLITTTWNAFIANL